MVKDTSRSHTNQAQDAVFPRVSASDSNAIFFREGNVGSASAPQPSQDGGVLSPDRDYPCLTDNNSIDLDNHGLRYLKERKKREEKFYKEIIKPKLSGYQNKSQQVLQNQITSACKEHGPESLAVLHLTFADDVTYPEAQKRINSLRTNVLAKRYRVNDKIYVLTICEKGSMNGRIHFHILAVKSGADFKTGTQFYYCPRAKKEKIRANDELRAEWEFFREVLPKYGLGDYVRIEPLKSIDGGARYFSKYVGKGHYSRDDSMVGKQLIRPSNGFRDYLGTKEINGVKFTAHQQINWVGGASAGRRIVLHDVGASYLVDDLGDLNYRLGSQWQHYAKDQMRACSCLAGFRIGSSSREFLLEYAKNQWGLQIVFDNQDDRMVYGAHRTGSLEFLNRTDLYEFALDHLLDRLEVVEEFQYDERTPVVQRLEPNNDKTKQDDDNGHKNNGSERSSCRNRSGADETMLFPWG